MMVTACWYDPNLQLANQMVRIDLWCPENQIWCILYILGLIFEKKMVMLGMVKLHDQQG